MQANTLDLKSDHEARQRVRADRYKKAIAITQTTGFKKLSTDQKDRLLHSLVDQGLDMFDLLALKRTYSPRATMYYGIYQN